MALDPMKLTITLVATTLLVLLLIALLAFSYARWGGLRSLLRQHHLRREARRKAADIEADMKRLEERQKKAQQQIALETLEGLYLANNLVGSGQIVKFGAEGGRGKDGFDLAIDPMSHTWGSGKMMAGMYGK